MNGAPSGRDTRGRDPARTIETDAIVRGAMFASSRPRPRGGFVFANCILRVRQENGRLFHGALERCCRNDTPAAH